MIAKRPGDDSAGGEFKKPRVEVSDITKKPNHPLHVMYTHKSVIQYSEGE